MTSPESPTRYRSLADVATLQLLTRNLGEGIYISRPDGTILDANPAFLAVFGVRTIGELGHFHAADLYADPARRTAWLEALERQGTVRDFEWELVRPDGERRTVLDTSYVVTDDATGERFIHGILFDITQRKTLENQLREQLTRDALTGCYNRRFLLDLEAQMRALGIAEWGCIFLDIDHFKLYNDSHGHQEGDLVLRRMARFLMRQVRAEEPVVRLGGDEFLILLRGEPASRTEEVARRLQNAAARSAPVAFSLGWAVRQGDEPLDATIDRADRGMIGVRVLRRSGDYPRLPDEMERRQS
ncbi:MAG TPA: sensor domain-containing diguanylate cyclase [Gemmatimonadaceae bacterium]|nr:sensor domain-containing diguanylate cyclase [Gemmatimonadaceae bacterium]